jgi:hypothetical protein
MIGASAASSNPSPYLNIRRNFDGREGVPVPSRLRLLSLDRRESRLYSKSLPIPHRASNALRFSPTHVNIPRSLQPLSPCLYSLHDPHTRTPATLLECAHRETCALLAKRGKALPRRKAAVSEAVPFYVLRPIVNTPTRRRYLYLLLRVVCSYTSPSTFVRMAWSSIAVAATRAACGCCFVRAKESSI